jgi:hypothetical protein
MAKKKTRKADVNLETVNKIESQTSESHCMDMGD